jgi:hypothetical protein
MYAESSCLLSFAVAQWLEVRFGDLMVVIIQGTGFWNVIPHGLVDGALLP